MTNTRKRTFENALERIRGSFDLCVYGYVVMPEYVHLLTAEPLGRTLADAIKSLKQGVSRRLIGEAEHFWQKRYYDFNVGNEPQFVEKLRYIHNNPVKRGLCTRAEDWEWSSFRQYATGGAGTVEIECEWTARKRERAAGRLGPGAKPPLKPKNGLNGPPVGQECPPYPKFSRRLGRRARAAGAMLRGTGRRG